VEGFLLLRAAMKRRRDLLFSEKRAIPACFSTEVGRREGGEIWGVSIPWDTGRKRRKEKKNFHPTFHHRKGGEDAQAGHILMSREKKEGGKTKLKLRMARGRGGEEVTIFPRGKEKMANSSIHIKLPHIREKKRGGDGYRRASSIRDERLQGEGKKKKGGGHRQSFMPRKKRNSVHP